MSKLKAVFICQSCTYQSPKWLGKCPECSNWNSFIEEIVSKESRPASSISVAKKNPVCLDDVDFGEATHISTGIGEFDRVLGGGVVPGGLVLIGGEPGIGKSTLLLNMASKISANIERPVLYISGEESLSQIAQRARRLKVNSKKILFHSEISTEEIASIVNQVNPGILIVDSIQTLISSQIASPPGTVSQLREATYELMNLAKSKNLPIFVVGHITKDGSIAGPKILEHMVDAVIYFEGDNQGIYRILRSYKNRFGNTNEVGVFEMGSSGLEEVKNPSEYFLENSNASDYGRAIVCTLEGTRPIFVEVQSLVVENRFGNGRRTTQGVDSNRLNMLVAIAEKYLSMPIGYNDIYTNVVGGLKLTSRDSDLAMLSSLLSSYKSSPIDNKTIFIGELGLSGEIRSVPQVEARIKEAAHLKYSRIITSDQSIKKINTRYPIEIVGISKINNILDFI